LLWRWYAIPSRPDALDEASAEELADSGAHASDPDIMEMRADQLQAGATGLRCNEGADTVTDGHGGAPR
jgi:hypothetical protein